MKSIETRFLAELADIYAAQMRLSEALPEMAKAVACEHLKKSILDHLEDTRSQVAKLEEVFSSFDLRAKWNTREPAEARQRQVEAANGSNAIDATRSDSSQKLEHDAPPTFGCLHEWLNCLDLGTPLPSSRRN